MGKPESSTPATEPDEMEALRWVAEFDPAPLITRLRDRCKISYDAARSLVIHDWLADRPASATKRRLEYLDVIAGGEVVSVEDDYL